MKTITIEMLAEHHIGSACKKAVDEAIQQQCHVQFDFNGQTVTASPDADPAKLADDYTKECYRKREELVNSPEYRRQQEEFRLAQERKDLFLKGALLAAPQMALKDEGAWLEFQQKNTDSYGSGVVSFTERWARLMQARMADGVTLGDIADECCSVADNEGITGFMYGCAVSILAQVWEHGEDLRHWHNLKTQLHDEGERANETGGVLNPALLSVLTDDDSAK